MSAYVVDKETIDALVTAAVIGSRGQGPAQGHLRLRWPGIEINREQAAIPGDWRAEFDRSAVLWAEFGREATPTLADEIGHMLWFENVSSVAYRYPDDALDDLPGPAPSPSPPDYTWRRTQLQPAVAILKAIGCYEYQSREHPGWPKSESYRFCLALRDAMISRLPGYAEAGWGSWPADLYSPTPTRAEPYNRARAW